jgi:hypothetical protein
MICPYNGFKECKWDDCAARLYVNNPCENGYQMKVCAIAYNGGTVPNPTLLYVPEQKQEVIR